MCFPFTKTSRCWWMWNASCSCDSELSPSDGSRRLSDVAPFDQGGLPAWSPGRSVQTIGVVSASGGSLVELLLDEPRVRAIPSATPTMTSATTAAAVGQKYL